jgi:alpha-L-fucosidase
MYNADITPAAIQQLQAGRRIMSFPKAAVMTSYFLLLIAAAIAQNFSDIKPSPQQVAWQDLEIGVLIHFGPNTFMDREWGDGNADPKVFNPTQLDAEQWVLAAKSAGAKYLVMVAKHHDGFCLWPTARTDYSVKNSPWKSGKGDVVREVEQAVRKHGLKFGIYLSPWDRHEPSYKNNAAYDVFYRRQLAELITRYGDLTELWLDGAGSEGHVYDFDSYVKELRTYQPNTLIFADTGFLSYGDIRWVGNEAGHAPEEVWNVIDRLGYLRWRPVEADTPLREHHWFWHPNDEKNLKPLKKLVDLYHESVGHGAQLMLGLAPDDRGLLPDSDVTRLRQFGEALSHAYKRNLAQGAVIASDSKTPAENAIDGNPDTSWSAPADARSAILQLSYKTPIVFDRSVLMESLNNGQLIHKYDIQIRRGTEWRTIAGGTSVGHRKIDRYPKVSASEVRLRILAAAGSPRIREFQLFDGSAIDARLTDISDKQ